MSGGGMGIGLGAPTGFAKPMTGRDYNQRLMQGETNEQIRASQAGLFGKGPSDAQWNQIVTQAGLESGRPLPGSAQFYQPVYQPQYQNYNMGNPMGVSQYGQSFGGFDGGYGGGFGGFNPYAMQMQTPFNPYTNSFQTPFSYMQQGQMGGYSGGMDGGPNAFMEQQRQYAQPGQDYRTVTQQQIQQAQQQQPQTNYGPSQQIVSRSAGLRGTPNVMRRAEGGIASLMDDE